MKLRQQLARHLELCNMSATALAKKTGIPKQTISDWLSGREPRKISQVKQAAEALGTTVDHLCFGDGENIETKKATELNALLGNDWVTGLFEIKLRRIKK